MRKKQRWDHWSETDGITVRRWSSRLSCLVR